MHSEHIIHAWDYHHGQATRVVLGGLPHLRGKTMAEKQQDFQNRFDFIRSSLMQEPRGHRNMLGAVVTDPVTPDGDVGAIFLSPQGFFDMCGDSTFSLAACLVDAGIVRPTDPNGEVSIRLDTVAGRVNVQVRCRNGEPLAITMANVASYALGEAPLTVPGFGSTKTEVCYGGLTYATVPIASLGQRIQGGTMDELLVLGSATLPAAREQVHFAGHPIDLITLWEPIDTDPAVLRKEAEEAGVPVAPNGRVYGIRVANFYAKNTTGRTPSGTGLSARLALEWASGRLKPGDVFFHESYLGLRFWGRIGEETVVDGREAIVPLVTTRSYLMGISQWVLKDDDPFRAGFVVG